MDFNNKRVLISGGSSGIGRALVVNLLNQGASVFTCARDVSTLVELQDQYPQLHVVQADICLAEHRQRIFNEILRSGETLDALFNNAGVQYAVEIGTAGDELTQQIEQELQINLCAQLQMCDKFLPLLKKSERALIVNVSSCLALTPKRSAPVYCASKAAISSFSRALAYQLEGSNVAVAVIYPPLVDTSMTAGREAKTISAESCAEDIVAQLGRGRRQVFVGKARALRLIHRVFPGLAARILKNS
ncbi:SDR family oxidoreductase [Agaribacterium haliotis]|uniref:SDR family oxidoreductase n=1 Tax=Agaribacterium haliotis TaxID=2013869 RepID=UPI000BB54229|nr:SDR family NAD(P)-dependent oxidoreductase [Agaribacterium haliotis]